MSSNFARQAAEQLARKFHEIYERLAPDYGYSTRIDTREFDPYTSNGRLMTAVCLEIQKEFDSAMAELRAENERLKQEQLSVLECWQLSALECWRQMQRERDEAREAHKHMWQLWRPKYAVLIIQEEESKYPWLKDD